MYESVSIARRARTEIADQVNISEDSPMKMEAILVGFVASAISKMKRQTTIGEQVNLGFLAVMILMIVLGSQSGGSGVN